MDHKFSFLCFRGEFTSIRFAEFIALDLGIGWCKRAWEACSWFFHQRSGRG